MEGDCPTSNTPHRSTSPPSPLATLLPPPQRTTPAPKSLRCGLGNRPPPPHFAPKENGQRAPATRPKDRQLGERECQTPNTTERGTGAAPWAPSCRPQSAQGQRARFFSCGLVTPPPPQAPPVPRQKKQQAPATRPKDGRSAERESLNPHTPQGDARRIPPGQPSAVSTARNASSQERAPWGW